VTCYYLNVHFQGQSVKDAVKELKLYNVGLSDWDHNDVQNLDWKPSWHNLW